MVECGSAGRAWIHPKDVVVMLSKQPQHLHTVCAGVLPGSTRALTIVVLLSGVRSAGVESPLLLSPPELFWMHEMQ